MPAHHGDRLWVFVIATALTMVVGAAIFRPASPRIFGAPTVGWHHDPFTMMDVWSRPFVVTPYVQPLTDLPGRWLVKAAGPVHGYNWLVLLSFPLAALAAHALAQHLAIGRLGAAVAALTFAFSPFHLAHAAYHPHIAQVQWVALYVLAVWHATTRGTVWPLVLMVLAALAVVLSNFYAGFIVALLTPVLIGAGWWLTKDAPAVAGRVTRVALVLGLTALAGATAVAWRAPAFVADRAAMAAPREDVSRYSARAMSYVVPPVANPIAGPAVARLWQRAGVDIALLEQQVSLGIGLLLLAAVAIVSWARDRTPRSIVPPLVLVAAVAALFSASPALVVASGLYDAAPMFRSYARFGVVVQLMAALLAGVGVSTLWRRGTTRARMVCVALVFLVAGEYAVAPSAMSRSVWPTEAHRWVHDQAAGVTVLECVPESPATTGAAWLTHARITKLQGLFADCGEPQLGDKLAATGFTHVIVPDDSGDAADFRAGRAPEGLRLAVQYDTVALWTVTALRPPVYVDTLTGWSDRERHPDAPGHSWRWMGAEATWTIVNTGRDVIRAQLTAELWAFHHAREIVVSLDSNEVEALQIATTRRGHVMRPLVLSPGTHTLTFRASTPPDRPAGLGLGDDQRALSLAIGRWHWTSVKEGL